MTGNIFVLRSEPGLSSTMERGRELGLPMEAMPLSRAEPLDWQVPEGAFDGILLGSANGVRHAGEALAQLRACPIYAVGEATAEEARALGFTVAVTGKGGLQALVDALPADRQLRLLRLAGEDHLPLSTPAHIVIATAITYRIVHRTLDEADIARLSAGGVVLLHSGEAARHFERECIRSGVERAHLSLAAIGPRVAQSVSDGWKSVATAATPDDPALLSLAADMCH